MFYVTVMKVPGIVGSGVTMTYACVYFGGIDIWRMFRIAIA